MFCNRLLKKVQKRGSEKYKWYILPKSVKFFDKKQLSILDVYEKLWKLKKLHHRQTVPTYPNIYCYIYILFKPYN